MTRNLLMTLLAIPALASAQHAACPLILPEGAVAVVRAPEGWLGSSPSLSRLTGGGMMRGHPKLMQYLVGSGSKKIKGGDVSTWEFSAGEEKWLWCTYGTAALQLSKRMDDAARACEVTTREERPGVIIEMVAVCR